MEENLDFEEQCDRYRNYRDPFVTEFITHQLDRLLRHHNVQLQETSEPETGDNAAAGAEAANSDVGPQMETEGISPLSSQLAGTSVTQSSSHMPAEVDRSSSSRPAVTVSDIHQTDRHSSSYPRVIVRDLVDIVHGRFERNQTSRTGQKRKAVAESEDSSEEQVASPKEPRNGKEDASMPSASASRVSEEKEKFIRNLLGTLSYYVGDNFPSNLEQQLRRLPEASVRSIFIDMDNMLYDLTRSFLMRSGYPRLFRRQPREEVFSDDDSDEDLKFKESIFPSQAKFQLTNMQRLTRYLILGNDTQIKVKPGQQLHTMVATLIKRMISEGEGEQVVELLKDISTRGRSSRQDTLLYCLAVCCRNADLKTKQAAYAAIQEICRIPTHLFQLISLIEREEESSGWGRGLRRALCRWYNSNATNPLYLAMHITKYWNRHGWCHRDLFRLAHIKPVNDSIGFIVRYCVKGMKEAEEEFLEDGYLGRADLEKVHKYLQAVEEVKKCEDSQRTVQLLQEHNLVREQLRTDMLNKPEVWAVMLPTMPLFALMRNLNKITNVGVFEDPANVEIVMSKLTNANALKKARIHPLKLLLTYRMYQQGHGEKGSLTWQPNYRIVRALEKAFYASFDSVEPTNKRILIALDISSSMDSTFPDYNFTVREASTVMAMVTARIEPHCDIVGFHTKLIPLDMFKDTSKTLDQMTTETKRLEFGSTDCSKPMTWARKHKKEYDAFIIYTDSETNNHRIAPHVALKKYRTKMNLPCARFVVVGMTSSEFTLSQPDDIYSMDVVGFDPDTPELIREFLTGELDF